jgi:hypothetical protein
MRTRGRVYAVAAAAAVALGATAALAPAGPATTQLSAQLRGAAEEPGPGDPNGKGEAFIAVKKAKRKVCFQLSYRRIDEPEAAHIHKGGRNDAGPVKVLLFEDPSGLPVPGAVDGCERTKRKIVRQLSRNPQKFYVNVHNDEFPDGAIRGQLKLAL